MLCICNGVCLFLLLRFFDLFEKCDGYKTGKLKLKKPKQLQVGVTILMRLMFMFMFTMLADNLYCIHLQEVLDIARQLLVELGLKTDCEIEESKAKLEQLKTVLEM